MARLYSLRIGQRLKVSGWPQLTVTGFYRIPDVSGDAGFGRGPAYFRRERGPASDNAEAGLSASSLDALLTSYATMAAISPTAQGTAVLDYPLITDHVRPGDVPALQSALDSVVTGTQLHLDPGTAPTGVPPPFPTTHPRCRPVLRPTSLLPPHPI